MIIQLSPTIPLNTPKGTAIAHFIIDNGIESDLLWVTFLDSNGECWTWLNRDIRAQKNVTIGRDHITPINKSEDVCFQGFE